MAIQERKTPIPPPSKIKSSIQSFTEDEMKQLRELKDKINEMTAQFGQLSLNKIRLERTEKELKDQLFKLEKEENTIAKSLSNKYGKGSIDLDSGTFTPTE